MDYGEMALKTIGLSMEEDGIGPIKSIIIDHPQNPFLLCACCEGGVYTTNAECPVFGTCGTLAPL